MKFTFTQASTGEVIETRDLPGYREATQRGKELHSFGHVLISAEVEESDDDEEEPPPAAKPSAPIPTKTQGKPAKAKRK